MKDNRGILQFVTETELVNIQKFAEGKETPLLIINLNRIEKNYQDLTAQFPFAKIYYAIKANPEKEVIASLNQQGSNFDVATRYEIQQLLEQGIPVEKLSYGNTIKKEKDIAFAYQVGIRLFASDSIMDLEKIARQAPGSKVFIRLLCTSAGADWPLSRKFGTSVENACELLLKARELGLIPYGLSFHVGSQQRDISQWDTILADCQQIFTRMKEQGIELKLINMGGGFPGHYLKAAPELAEYASQITGYLHKYFGDELPEIILEPGRSIAADTGVIISEVINVAKKTNGEIHNWVYVDIGKFGGLMETADESLKYPIFVESDLYNDADKNSHQEIILAGPTCDSADILYEHFKYSLPDTLREGTKLYFMTTGAYTSTYSAVYFNGLPPLKTYVGRF